MRLRGAVALAVFLASTAAAVPASAGAIVIVSEAGDISAESLRTIRSIAGTELRSRGVDVREDEALTGVLPVGPETMRLAERLGADRVFVFRFGQLGKKVLMSLEELAPPGQKPLHVARLTASSLDESDIVVPRLVRAVLERKPVEEGQRIATMTDEETAPFKKKAGEGLFILGVGLAPLGGSIGWSYEARSWRLGLLLQGAEDDPGFFGVEGAWIPLDRSISPYFSAGLGVVSDGDSVLGGKLEAGAEFFRLHGVRLFTGVSAVIPFESFSYTDTDTASFGLFIRVGF